MFAELLKRKRKGEFMEWLGTFIIDTLGGILYSLFAIVFVFIDLVQDMFLMFAGVQEGLSFGGNPITAINDGGDTSTGIIYFLFRNDLVQNLLTSIALLSIFLLLIFTAMAFIKNVYSSKPKTWQDIVGNAFKGLANFVFIPVCCLLGIWLGNILLNAINGATSVGGATVMSRKLFVACAYNANHLRDGTDVTDDEITKIKAMAEYYTIIGTDQHVTFDENFQGTAEKSRAEYYADVVDQIYAQTNISLYTFNWNVGQDKMRTEVGDNYSLGQVNYLVLIVGGIFMLYVLGSLSFGMIKRMYMLVVLFVISPATCAYYPLDDGGATGKWKGSFVKEVISVYGAVAGLNIFFSLMPLIDQIGFGDGITEILVGLVLLICGLYVVKDLISTIGGFFGMDNTYSSGQSLMKSTSGALQKYVTKPVTTGAFRMVGAWSAGPKAGLTEPFRMAWEGLAGKKKPGDAWYNREGGLLGKAYGAMGIKGSDLKAAAGTASERADAQDEVKRKKFSKKWLEDNVKKGEYNGPENAYETIKEGGFRGVERDKIIKRMAKGDLEKEGKIKSELDEYEKRLEEARAKKLKGGGESGGSGGTGGTGGGGTGGGDTIIHNHYYGSSGESGEIRTIDRTGDFYISELDGAKITMDNARTDIANAGVARAGAQSGLDEAYAALVKFAEEKMKPLEGSAAVRRNMHRIESGEVGINHLDINALEHTRLRDFVPELTQLLDTYKQKRAELHTAEQAELATQKAYEAVVRKTIGNIDHMSEQFTDIKKHLQEFDDATRKSKDEMDEFIEAVKKAIKK